MKVTWKYKYTFVSDNRPRVYSVAYANSLEEALTTVKTMNSGGRWWLVESVPYQVKESEGGEE